MRDKNEKLDKRINYEKILKDEEQMRNQIKE